MYGRSYKVNMCMKLIFSSPRPKGHSFIKKCWSWKQESDTCPLGPCIDFTSKRPRFMYICRKYRNEVFVTVMSHYCHLEISCYGYSSTMKVLSTQDFGLNSSSGIRYGHLENLFCDYFLLHTNVRKDVKLRCCVR